MSGQNDQLEFVHRPKAAPERGGLSPGSLALLAGLLGLTLVLALQLSRQNATRPMSGSAPDFELALFSGERIRLNDYRGRVLLVNFWASWCPPCRAEAPDLQALYQDYRAEGFTVIGVNMLESSQRKALDFIAEFGIAYPNVEDIGERVTNLYRVEAPPESFLIDRAGHVRRVFIGSIRYDNARYDIEALLAEQR